MFNLFSGKSKSGYKNGFKDEAYTQEQVSFMRENQGVLKKLIHRTRDYADSLSILKNGLVVEGSLSQCVDAVGVSKEAINISNIFNARFGKYSLIIGLPVKTDIDSYLIPAHSLSSPIIEEIIGEEEFDKPQVLLSKYIAGIANQNTGEIIKNPNYDPFDKQDSSLDSLVKSYTVSDYSVRKEAS